jgi:hypothetical protein
MNASFFRHDRAPPGVAAYLQGLRATLDDLGERVREHIAEAVGRAVAAFVQRGVRALLERCHLGPDGGPHREPPPLPDYDDGLDPYEDEAGAYLVEEEGSPPPRETVSSVLTAAVRRVGGWLRRRGRWTGLPVLGSLLVAGAGVLGSAAGLLALADTACASASLLTDLFAP